MENFSPKYEIMREHLQQQIYLDNISQLPNQDYEKVIYNYFWFYNLIAGQYTR